MNVRANRVSEQMKKELGDILNRKIKDPRLGFVTVTGVDVTGDLQEAKVFISILGTDKEKEIRYSHLRKRMALSALKSVAVFDFVKFQKCLLK